MSVRAALVTGGSRGIGRAIVEALVAREWAIAFTWRSDEGAARSLEAALGGRARAFHFDLADRQRPATLRSEIEAAVGPLCGLVNNAGQRRDSILAMTSDAEWDELLDVNLGGVFRVSRAVLPGMMHRRCGSIVNVSSLSALHGVPGQTAYAASKSGIVGLTRALAREVGPRGIRVNAILPGFISTDLAASLSPERVAALRSMECLPDGVSLPSVGALVAFLLSDEAASISGQALVVDAGASA